MKRLLGLLFVFCLMGCTSSTPKSLSNSDYTAQLAKALEARWVLTDAKDTATETKDDYESYVNAELKVLDALKDREFENTDMKKLADDYLQTLHDSMDVLTKYWGTNQYDEHWHDVYNQRTILLSKINDLETIPVTKQSQLDGLINQGKLNMELDKIIKNAHFTTKDKKEDYKTYKATIENTTGQSFDYFSINVKLYDKNGTVVETTSASTQNWAAGEKHVFEFSTDKAVERVDVASVEY